MEPKQDELLRRIEQLEKQRAKTLQFNVLLAAGLIAISPAVIMIVGFFVFEFHSTIEDGKPSRTELSTRQLPEPIVIQIIGSLGTGIAGIFALLNRSERFQQWIGLRAKDED